VNQPVLENTVEAVMLKLETATEILAQYPVQEDRFGHPGPSFLFPHRGLRQGFRSR
jgi:hypothetical protein